MFICLFAFIACAYATFGGGAGGAGGAGIFDALKQKLGGFGGNGLSQNGGGWSNGAASGSSSGYSVPNNAPVEVIKVNFTIYKLCTENAFLSTFLTGTWKLCERIAQLLCKKNGSSIPIISELDR